LFEKALQEHNIIDRLDFEQVFKVLVSLGVVFNFANKHEANIRIMTELWKILRGDLYQGIQKSNLYLFLLIALRLPIPMKFAASLKPSMKQLKDSSFIGIFNEEGLWKLSFSDEIKIIQRKFEIFYLNKLSNDKPRNASKTPENSRKGCPSISPISKMLALHHREKLLNEVLYLVHNNEEIEGLEFKLSENKILNNVDLMVLQKKIQKLHHQYLQEEKQKKESAVCTFNPEINDKKIPKNRSRINSFSNLGNMKYKKDKDPLIIEYEKAKKECTFKPEIKKKMMVVKNRGAQVKNEKKTVDRMRNARLEKEFIETCRQRGMHSSHITKEKQQNYNSINNTTTISPKNISEETKNFTSEGIKEEKIPLLFVDVNLGANQNERIVIYEGDRSDELAKEFCRLHGEFFLIL